MPILADQSQNVAQQAADADLTIAAALANTMTIALAAGASNIMRMTATMKDAAGVTVTGVHRLDLMMSGDSAGADITAAAYSGTLAAITGKIIATITAKKHFIVQTDANGVFVGDLTDTGKPATEYVAIKKPLGSALFVSAASGTSWGA